MDRATELHWYPRELGDGESMAPTLTNTLNTIQSADSHFSNGIESYRMKTDADTGPGHAGGTYQMHIILLNDYDPIPGDRDLKLTYTWLRLVRSYYFH